jgi:hypothetical protein
MSKPSFKEALAAKKKAAEVVPKKAKKPTIKEVFVEKMATLSPLDKDELPHKALVAFTAARSHILDTVNKWKAGKKFVKMNIHVADDHLEFSLIDEAGEKADSIHIFNVVLDDIVRSHL